jgi:hypothetical protein
MLNLNSIPSHNDEWFCVSPHDSKHKWSSSRNSEIYQQNFWLWNQSLLPETELKNILKKKYQNIGIYCWDNYAGSFSKSNYILSDNGIVLLL